jgi:hypothetical protein
MRMIRITTDTTATTMGADITATGVDMREEVGIGITIRMVGTRIVGTTVGQIVPVEVGVVGVGDASLLLL